MERLNFRATGRPTRTYRNHNYELAAVVGLLMRYEETLEEADGNTFEAMQAVREATGLRVSMSYGQMRSYLHEFIDRHGLGS